MDDVVVWEKKKERKELQCFVLLLPLFYKCPRLITTLNPSRPHSIHHEKKKRKKNPRLKNLIFHALNSFISLAPSSIFFLYLFSWIFILFSSWIVIIRRKRAVHCLNIFSQVSSWAMMFFLELRSSFSKEIIEGASHRVSLGEGQQTERNNKASGWQRQVYCRTGDRDIT